MLIKNLFNLETNSTANMPNEYFLMLEKEEKYNDLFQKLQKLNQHNQNLIQSMSTIKITFIELINDFIKPNEDSIIVKFQQAFVSTFEVVSKACSNLQKSIETKLFNYQPQIEKLNKQYKQQLEQLAHYRKKVQSIRKGPLDTRQDKEKLNRNIEKKRTIEMYCQRTERILIQNYEIFHKQSEQYLKIVPHEIMVSFIQGNLESACKIIQAINEEVSFVRNRLRRQSIMSSIISEISDGSDEKLSEYSESDFQNDNEIKIIIEPESDEVLMDEIEILQIAKNQETSDDHLNEKYKIQIHQTQSHRKNMKKSTMKRSLLRRSSIQQTLKNKDHFIEKVKKILNYEAQVPPQKILNVASLQKAFQNIKAPITNAEKMKRIFNSTKNRYCLPTSKPRRISKNEQEKTILNTREQFHEKSFVLEKQEFKNKHSVSNLTKNQQTRDERIKKQQTLNSPSEDQQCGSYGSPNHQQVSVSLSSSMSNKNEKSINQNPDELKKNIQRVKERSNPNIKIERNGNFKTEQKIANFMGPQKIMKFEPKTQLKHHPTFNHLPNYPFGSIQEFQKANVTPKTIKMGENQKKKVIQHLFSIPSQRIVNHKQRQKIQNQNKKLKTLQNDQPQTDLKFWFSTNFSSNKDNIQGPNKITEIKQNYNTKINEQKLHPYTTQNLKTLPSSNKIDFSIFDKIV